MNQRMPHPPALPEAGLARDFAAQQLGPESARALADPAAMALVLARMRAGARLGDAVLAQMHRAAREDGRVAEEFAGYLALELGRLGHGQAGAGLRRFLDTCDLVQSVLGDLWPEVFELEFVTREQFLALLAARVRWKAADLGRRMKAGHRREDLRSAAAPEDFAAAHTPSPVTEAAAHEDLERLAALLARLPERDARLLRSWLQGRDWEEIGAAEGMTVAAARKAVQRAIGRAGELAG
jgi:DNA-directed RNA polymerase specialized sigma24 family protein